MVPRKPSDRGRSDRIVAEGRRARAEWESSYRGRALKLLPWVCASCGRDFVSKSLSELTVHHKDHDHTNNPPDGSNWELLCYWCHDNEHSRRAVAESSGTARHRDQRPAVTQSPFVELDKLLKSRE